MNITNLHELFLHELKDLYSAEEQIIKALPKMISAATHEKLKMGLQEHLEETKQQLERLETISQQFDFKVQGHECKGIKGIIMEGEETLKDIVNAYNAQERLEEDKRLQKLANPGTIGKRGETVFSEFSSTESVAAMLAAHQLLLQPGNSKLEA